MTLVRWEVACCIQSINWSFSCKITCESNFRNCKDKSVRLLLIESQKSPGYIKNMCSFSQMWRYQWQFRSKWTTNLSQLYYILASFSLISCNTPALTTLKRSTNNLFPSRFSQFQEILFVKSSFLTNTWVEFQLYFFLFLGLSWQPSVFLETSSCRRIR